MATRRIYVVTETQGKDVLEHLVEAGSQSQAVRHMVKARFEAVPAKSSEVARLMKAGATVQAAGDDDE